MVLNVSHKRVACFSSNSTHVVHIASQSEIAIFSPPISPTEKEMHQKIEMKFKT